MSGKTERRLLRDFKKIQASDAKVFGYTASLESGSNLFQWNAAIFGTEGSEWEGAVLRLSFEFPSDYPQSAPTVKFVNVIPFHPNVYSNGNICIDILQHNWSSAYDVSAILTAIQSLLNDPNPNSPANHEAADLFVHNRAEYNRRVRISVESTWTH